MLALTSLTLGAAAFTHPPEVGSPVTAGAPAPPQDDPFYQPPERLPAVPPGTVLRSRPVTLRALALPVPARAWQILYRSTDTGGAPNAVSGTVLVPRDGRADRARPLVAYNPASHGLAPQCAPSYRLRRGDDPEAALIGQALIRGWAVVVSDYEGSGTPGPHTYGAGRATGRAVLDGVRAARRLPPAGLGGTAPVGLWGYSEGGLASAWAAELAPAYAPDLELAGVAAGGVPADLAGVAARIDGTEFFGLLLAGAVGLDHAYPAMDLPALLNERGRAAYRRIQTMCVAELTRTYAYDRMDDYTTVPDATDLPRVRRVLADNRLGRRTPAGPLHLYQAARDRIVPVEDVRRLVRRWCRAGARVDYHEDPVAGHVTLAASGAPSAVRWLADRFAGRPAPSTC